MLEVQKYLQNGGTLAALQADFGIKSTLHDDGRVILNYNMIDSYDNKTHPIVCECRGLVLDQFNQWALVARAFPRFFNLGEVEVDFHFPCSATDKEDGSLILVYHWNNSFHINTRGSFGDGQVGASDFTWRQLFHKAAPTNFLNTLVPGITYVFELCSRYNKVVRDYETPTAYLLGCFDGKDEIPVNNTAFQRPKEYTFFTPESVTEYVESSEDPSYEGVVLRDFNGQRIKYKQQDYVRLHKLSNNGAIAAPKNLLRLILTGELEEVLCYFPEMASLARGLHNKYLSLESEVDDMWFCYGDIANRKKFAEKVKNHPFSWALFKAKDTGVNPIEILHSLPDNVIRSMGY